MKERPLFSRPPGTTGFGKNDVPAKTMVPRDILSDLDAKVKAEGFRDRSEWLRLVVIAKARGIGEVRSLNERRLQSVAEMVPEKDL